MMDISLACSAFTLIGGGRGCRLAVAAGAGVEDPAQESRRDGRKRICLERWPRQLARRGVVDRAYAIALAAGNQVAHERDAANHAVERVYRHDRAFEVDLVEVVIEVSACAQPQGRPGGARGRHLDAAI